MSNCIKDLYDYNLIKKCSKCENISLKSNFHKNKNRKDGLQAYCKICIIQKQKQYDVENRDKKREYYHNNRNKIHSRMNDYYLQNRDRINNRNKDYRLENRNRIMAQKKIYTNNRYKTDVNYRLICKTRSRIYKSLRGLTKQSSSRDILGIDIDLYRKWIEFQFPSEMTWDNIEIDHVKPICMFDLSKDEELKEVFNWKNTQPLLKKDHQSKGTKFNFLDYQLQFIKAYQFIKLNEERFNENIH